MDTTYLSTSEINNLKVTERHACELCDVVMPMDDLTPYDGYKACSGCIEASEAEKKENEPSIDLPELYQRVGFNDACIKIYDMFLSGEIKEPIDILHLVKLK